MQSLIDTIIVNYNTTDYLLKCLRPVYDEMKAIGLRIFVEDNCSKDRPERFRNARRWQSMFDGT